MQTPVPLVIVTVLPEMVQTPPAAIVALPAGELALTENVVSWTAGLGGESKVIVCGAFAIVTGVAAEVVHIP